MFQIIKEISKITYLNEALRKVAYCIKSILGKINIVFPQVISICNCNVIYVIFISSNIILIV